jgi:hypothetical protein
MPDSDGTGTTSSSTGWPTSSICGTARPTAVRRCPARCLTSPGSTPSVRPPTTSATAPMRARGYAHRSVCGDLARGLLRRLQRGLLRGAAPAHSGIPARLRPAERLLPAGPDQAPSPDGRPPPRLRGESVHERTDSWRVIGGGRDEDPTGAADQRVCCCCSICWRCWDCAVLNSRAVIRPSPFRSISLKVGALPRLRMR